MQSFLVHAQWKLHKSLSFAPKSLFSLNRMHLTVVVQRKTMATLTDEERQQVISHLMERGTMANGQFKLNRSAQKDTAIFFNVSQSTVNKIWTRAVANRLDPAINAYVAPSAIRGNTGRPQLYDRDELQLQVSEFNLSDRRSMRSLAGHLGISVWSVWMLIRVENVIIPHSNAVKPWLTDENKETRFQYAADEVEKVSSAAGIEYRFKGGYDTATQCTWTKSGFS
jgi:hypothetical protein